MTLTRNGRLTHNQVVAGSSPRGGATKKEASVYTGAFLFCPPPKGS